MQEGCKRLANDLNFQTKMVAEASSGHPMTGKSVSQWN